MKQNETSLTLNINFEKHKLIPAMIVEHPSNQPLMLAYMNQQALDKTLQTGYVHFYSRSRQSLWCKGETSGNKLKLINAKIDCDQDTLFISVKVEGEGVACHTGRKSCFYRTITKDKKLKME